MNDKRNPPCSQRFAVVFRGSVHMKWCDPVQHSKQELRVVVSPVGSWVKEKNHLAGAVPENMGFK